MPIPKRKLPSIPLEEPKINNYSLKEEDDVDTLLDPEEGSIEITDEDLGNTLEDEYTQDSYEDSDFYIPEDINTYTPEFDMNEYSSFEENNSYYTPPVEENISSYKEEPAITPPTPPQPEKKQKSKRNKKNINFKKPYFNFKANPLLIKAGGIIIGVLIVMFVVSYFMGDTKSSSSSSSNESAKTNELPEITKVAIENDELIAVLGKAKADYSNVVVSGAVRMPEGISSCSSDPVDIKKSDKAKVKLSCETGSVDSNFKYKDYLLEATEVK